MVRPRILHAQSPGPLKDYLHHGAGSFPEKTVSQKALRASSEEGGSAPATNAMSATMPPTHKQVNKESFTTPSAIGESLR